MPRRPVRRNGGFALLIVLWTLVLIAFLVLHLTASGRTEIRIADNLVDNAVAAAAADGAISEAIFNLSNPKPEQRWPLDGAAHPLTIGNSRVVVRLEDEASRINPNLASPALMEALLRALGSDPDSARRLASAIADWVGSAPTPRPQEALFADYRAAGLDYGPPAGAVRDYGRTRPGARHDTGIVRRSATPFDLVRPRRTEPNRRRPDRNRGPGHNPAARPGRSARPARRRPIC